MPLLSRTTADVEPVVKPRPSTSAETIADQPGGTDRGLATETTRTTGACSLAGTTKDTGPLAGSAAASSREPTTTTRAWLGRRVDRERPGIADSSRARTFAAWWAAVALEGFWTRPPLGSRSATARGADVALRICGSIAPPIAMAYASNRIRVLAFIALVPRPPTRFEDCPVSPRYYPGGPRPSSTSPPAA